MLLAKLLFYHFYLFILITYDLFSPTPTKKLPLQKNFAPAGLFIKKMVDYERKIRGEGLGIPRR